MNDTTYDDIYDGFNTENYLTYSDGTCAIYSGVGGDSGMEELYMILSTPGNNSLKEVELKWYD